MKVVAGYLHGLVRPSSTLAFMLAIAMLAVFAAGCGGGKKAGAEIPASMVPTALADVLAKPASFKGKKVLLEGVVTWVCPTLCEFTYAEGSESVTVFPKDFTMVKYQKGQRIKVLAEVYRGEKSTVISALGLEPR